MSARHRKNRWSQITVLDLQRQALAEVELRAMGAWSSEMAAAQFGLAVKAAELREQRIAAEAAVQKKQVVVDVPAQKGWLETTVIDGREYVVVTGWAPKAPVGVESEWVLK